MKLRLAAATVFALAFAGVCATWAQTEPPSAWKWRDASGRVTVSDLPPPQSVPDKDILVRPPLQLRAARPAASAAETGPKPTAGAAAQRTDPELEARRRRAADEQLSQQRTQEQKVAAQRTENCDRAKSHLAGLETGQRIVRSNAQGEREVLDDKGRADEMQRARAVIASDCK
jgi:hypothetical protein